MLKEKKASLCCKSSLNNDSAKVILIQIGIFSKNESKIFGEPTTIVHIENHRSSQNVMNLLRKNHHLFVVLKLHNEEYCLKLG